MMGNTVVGGVKGDTSERECGCECTRVSQSRLCVVADILYKAIPEQPLVLVSMVLSFPCYFAFCVFAPDMPTPALLYSNPTVYACSAASDK
jgi:hypothetical protein